MSGHKKEQRAAALLLLLATASFAVAAITITNITEWYIIAKHPPIVKVIGASLQNTSYIYNQVYHVYAGDGTNRTVILLTAFTGDPTEYTEVIKICNKDNVTYGVKLVYQGHLYLDWTHIQYATIWLQNMNNSLELTTADIGDGTGWVKVPSGECVPVGIRILVKAGAPYDETVVGFQIDVVSQSPPP